MLKRSLRAATAALALVLTASACGGSDDSSTSEGPIKIGMVLSLSGPAAPFGAPTKTAIEAVVDKVNEDGGINGRDIELISYDDKTDPTEAAKGARSVIDDGAVAIIGSSTGSGTLALAPVAAAAKVPVLAGNSTDEVVDPESDTFPWVFRSVPSNTVYADLVFERVASDGHTRPAIFYQEDAYGEFATDLMKKGSDSAPEVEIVETKSAALDATDVTAQATALRNADPDAVILNLSSVALGAAALRAFQDVGLDVPIYGAAGIAQPALLEQAGDAAEGMVAPGIIDPSNPTEGQQALWDLIEASGDEPSFGFADVIGGGTAQVLVDALMTTEEGATLDGTAVRDALQSGEELNAYQSDTVSYSGDDHSGPTGAAWIVAENGKFVAAP